MGNASRKEKKIFKRNSVGDLIYWAT